MTLSIDSQSIDSQFLFKAVNGLELAQVKIQFVPEKKTCSAVCPIFSSLTIH